MAAAVRHVQGLGITSVNGDIVIDRSAFETTVENDPAAFDGEPLRLQRLARCAAAELQVGQHDLRARPRRPVRARELRAAAGRGDACRQVPLSPGECGDWRAALRADYGDPNRIRFNGGFPAACRREELGRGLCRSAQLPRCAPSAACGPRWAGAWAARCARARARGAASRRSSSPRRRCPR